MVTAAANRPGRVRFLRRGPPLNALPLSASTSPGGPNSAIAPLSAVIAAAVVSRGATWEATQTREQSSIMSIATSTLPSAMVCSVPSIW